MTKAPRTVKRIKWIVVSLMLFGVIVLIAIIYGIGTVALPKMIENSYTSKNCTTVTQLDQFYIKVYPSLAAINAALSDKVTECNQYGVAQDAEKNKDWQGAYTTFKAYTDQYPQGLFVKEAHEQAALSLTTWAKDLTSQQKFENAITELDNVVQNYSDTPSAPNAKSLINSTYLAWEQGQQASKDFTGAESTIKQWQAWAQNNGDNQGLKQAQAELPKMYLEWGVDLQNKKDFAGAEDKLNQVIATDLSGQIAPQANTLILSLQTALGDSLIATGSFEQAIESYKKAVTLSDQNHQPAAKDVVAKAYLAWADSLTKMGDFLGALDRIKDAEANLGTDAIKQNIEAERTATYKAFSNSSGDQATNIISTQVKAVCEEGPKSELPIIGIDSSLIHAASYGDIDPLSTKVNAVTPGSLHYVVCVKLTKVILERRRYFEYLARTQLIWDVTLRDAVFGTIVKTNKFLGPTPQAFLDPSDPRWQEAGQYVASPPSMDALVAWLLTVMK